MSENEILLFLKYISMDNKLFLKFLKRCGTSNKAKTFVLLIINHGFSFVSLSLVNANLLFDP